jgi:hypothetical protein
MEIPNIKPPKDSTIGHLRSPKESWKESGMRGTHFSYGWPT